MKKLLSKFERNSFAKYFSLSLFCLVFFLGLVTFIRTRNDYIVHSQEIVNFDDGTDFLINSFLQNERNFEQIRIYPPKDIRVVLGNEGNVYLAYSDSVINFLEKYNIEYSEDDIILPSLDTNIQNTKIIKIILINKKFVEVVKDIPFETQTIVDNNLTYGEEIIEQQGKVGKTLYLYKDIYENGIYVRSEMQEEEILEAPMAHIVRIGNKRAVLGVANCPHWYDVVDGITVNEDEREILKFLMLCETGCNDSSNNNNRYLGLLQFSKRTFASYGGVDIWDGADQIRTALRIVRKGGMAHHWPGCTRSFNQN
jgi:hypothetical protein